MGQDKRLAHERIAEQPGFREALVRGANAADLRRRFPGLGGEATYRRAARYLRGLDVRADREQPTAAVPAAVDLSEQVPTLTESREQTGDTLSVSLPRTRIHTLAQLLEYCEVDGEEWAVDTWSCTKWEIGAKNNDGEIVVEPLYRVKATLKRKAVVTDARVVLTRLLEEVRGAFPSLPPVTFTRSREDAGLMWEPSIYDHHFGKLSWHAETGGGNYDLAIARDLYRRGLERLIQRAPTSGITRICYVVGNDLLHTDNLLGATTKGTPQDCDGRYQKVFAETTVAITWGVETLRQIAPVEVVMVSGNHDHLAVFHLGAVLEARFHGDAHVTVDNRPLSRKYLRHGKVMLGFTHGDKQKLQDLPLSMATDEPAMWGQTTFREIHTGDKHHFRSDEFKGVRVRIIPSLCTADAWHAQHGYRNALRSAEAFTWDPEEGLVGTALFNVTETLT